VSTAKKLPFRIDPVEAVKIIGDQRSGELVFPVKGDLSVREQIFINEGTAKHSSFLEIAKLSNKIAKAEKILPLAAHKFLSDVIAQALGMQDDLGEKAENMRLKYAREIEELSGFLLLQQWRRQLVTATAMIKYRLEGMEDYTVEDSESLGKNLVGAIYQFALEEELSAAPAIDAEQIDRQTEESLGE
jgi:hypothetical protein